MRVSRDSKNARASISLGESQQRERESSERALALWPRSQAGEALLQSLTALEDVGSAVEAYPLPSGFFLAEVEGAGTQQK